MEANKETKLPYHLHLAEDKYDMKDSMDKYKKTVVERLASVKILSKNTLAAHCVHIKPQEIKQLRELDIFVAHNPESNMNNAVGYAHIPEMLKNEVTVGLGTDGYTANILQEIKSLPLLHKFAAKDPRTMGFDQITKISFHNNSKIATTYFNQQIGQIKENSRADLVILNYNPPTPLTQNNFMGHIIFGINPSHIESVLVNGKFVMKDKIMTGIDEEEITAKSREITKKLWAKL